MSDTTTPTKHYLLWIDVETTAIKPEDGQLLEVGMRITNLDGSEVAPQTVNAPYAFSTIIPHARLDYTPATERAFKMHQENGLLSMVFWYKNQLSIGTWLLDCIDKLQDNNGPHAILHPAGTNVDFDLEWLKDKQAPLFFTPIWESNVSYRKLDMSTIRLTLTAVGIDPYQANHKTTHRVDDCLDRDIHDYMSYIEWVKTHEEFSEASLDPDEMADFPVGDSLHERFESEDDE